MGFNLNQRHCLDDSEDFMIELERQLTDNGEYMEGDRLYICLLYTSPSPRD